MFVYHHMEFSLLIIFLLCSIRRFISVIPFPLLVIGVPSYLNSFNSRSFSGTHWLWGGGDVVLRKTFRDFAFFVFSLYGSRNKDWKWASAWFELTSGACWVAGRLASILQAFQLECWKSKLSVTFMHIHLRFAKKSFGQTQALSLMYFLRYYALSISEDKRNKMSSASIWFCKRCKNIYWSLTLDLKIYL